MTRPFKHEFRSLPRITSSTKHYSVLSLSLSGLLLTGCAVGPDFKSPDAPATSQYTPQALTSTASTPVAGGEGQQFLSGQPVPERWWSLYESDALNTLVNDAVAHSPSLTAAQATLKQAQQTLIATRSGLFPKFDGNASATREKTLASTETEATSLYNLFNASVSVSYALDLFGGVRRATEAQAAQVDYQQNTLNATYQTLTGNVVTAAIQQASLRAQLEATQDIIRAEQAQLTVIEQQQQLGGAALSDVLSARSNLASTQASMPALQTQLNQTQNQLAVYLGQLPSDYAGSHFDLAQLKLPTDIPLAVPSELVRRRPDVRQAEAQLHEASAQVGVAIANRLPQLSINASYGSAAGRSSDLFDQNIWSLGASLSQPIFHAGELSARQKAAEAAYTAAEANYKQAVLVAFQNVADSLQALDRDAQVLQAQHTASDTADQSLKLTEAQFKLGATSYLGLLTAQRQAQQAKIAYVQSLAARYSDTAALFLALGGSAPAELQTAAATTGTAGH